jgi:hypothetical protein
MKACVYVAVNSIKHRILTCVTQFCHQFKMQHLKCDTTLLKVFLYFKKRELHFKITVVY